MRFRLTLEYDGSAYKGWQFQVGQKTVQGEIENALKRIFSDHIRVIGAGRTDTGVHARGQVAHFDLDFPSEPNRLLRSLNGILNSDIRMKDISAVDSKFHARFSAKFREYHYYISTQPTALLRNYSWHLTYDLDLSQLNKAAQIIKGKNDFTSFCRSNSEVNNHYCHIKKAGWLKIDDQLVFIIQADRFLHGMVRALVGTFVDIGRKKLEVTDIKDILKDKNRSSASQSAPARGLILEKVIY
jgi:tRNA pseudouridine38-40 synthase